MIQLNKTIYPILFVLILASCNDESPSNSESAESERFWSVSNMHEVSNDGEISEQILGSADKSFKQSSNDLRFTSMKLKVKDRSEYEVFIATKRENSIGNDTKNKSTTDSTFDAEETNWYYIPSLDKTLKEEIDYNNFQQKGGRAKYTYPNGSQIMLEIKKGLPVKKISLNEETSFMAKKPCLDCGTTECYKTAKDACDGGADCKFTCDLLDYVFACTGSIMTACFIYNNT